MSKLEIEQLPALDDYQLVIHFKEPSAGLSGFVAIHNEQLGPAVGGTRMFPYASEKEAFIDVLRLSRAMTYKCALAGVHHGGGKGVIIGNPDKNKTKDLLKAYAEVINSLKGRFFTGEDVGISEADVQWMLKSSDYFIGKSNGAGDPSPYAALSSFYSIQVAARERFGNANLDGRKIAVKGVGKVGSELVRLLKKEGAEVTVADIRPYAIEAIKKEFHDLPVASTEEIHALDVDIFAPCALGNDVTLQNVNEVKAKIICGGANNQFPSLEVSDKLYQRGVLVVPDYVANAGGLINVVDELEKEGYNNKRVLQRIENVKNTLNVIFLLSKQKKLSPSRVADELAEEIFKRHNTTVQ